MSTDKIFQVVQKHIHSLTSQERRIDAIRHLSLRRDFCLSDDDLYALIAGIWHDCNFPANKINGVWDQFCHEKLFTVQDLMEELKVFHK